ncbi:MAG: hypothetical protein IT299_00585 [Dehalococcoidia bacterium]|nr:hypothetical protein [Dehalococcoidia bacterium]
MLSALATSRAEFSSILELLAPDDFQRPEVADQIWRAGAADDRARLVIDQSLAGRTLTAPPHRARPAYLVTHELLLAWLAQTRGALVARVRRLASGDLDRSLDLDGCERRTIAALLQEASERDAAAAAALHRGGRPPAPAPPAPPAPPR